MSDLPRISCIVPVYNQSRYITAALDSIFEQTLPVDEVIVVDDGSSDDVACVVADYPRELVFFSQANQGPAAARNAAIKRATGDWLAFLDADDLWHPDKLALQWAAFQQDPEIDYCLAHKRNFWEASMADEESRLRREEHPMVRDVPAYTFQAMMIKKETFTRIGYLDESLRVGEDTDWFVRAEDLGFRREVLPQVLFQRRLHETNISYQNDTAAGRKDREALIMAAIARRKAQKREASGA